MDDKAVFPRRQFEPHDPIFWDQRSMSSKKYLSLDEAAQKLGLRNDELNRLREKNEVRGFADRGTWKFKVEDIEELARRRQVDSSPEVPMFRDPEPESNDPFASLDNPESAFAIGGDSAMVLDEDGEAEDPTVIRKSRDPLSSSDSDVRLVFDEPMVIDPSESGPMTMMESDSDVRLVGNRLPESDSDSDVKLVSDLDSDSDVRLVGEETIREISLSRNVSAQKGSDSDVRLVPPKSDSDVKIVGNELDRDSDVKLVSPENNSDSDVNVIQSSDTSDSDIQLLGASDSAIPLGFSVNDSGISLGGHDSGISLSLGDSGISLESVGDSGISLEDSPNFGGTIPMMDVAKDLESVPETKFEIPAMRDDSAFELRIDGEDQSGESTQVMNSQDFGEGPLDDAVFNVDDGDSDLSGDDDLEVTDDAFADDDDDVEDMEVFGADDDAFAGDDGDGVTRPVRAGVADEHDWSMGTVAMLCVSTVLLSLCMFLMFDLVKTMWVSQPGTPVASALLDALGGMFKE